ncbi:unnamed protein product [Symbiodinium sp. CCMP2592]|nr:unnamed protein product [Symbiodinium sp. CCMP2592]
MYSDPRAIQLCGDHSSDRTAMFQQAARTDQLNEEKRAKKKGAAATMDPAAEVESTVESLKERLVRMEREEPEEFVEHLKDFSVKTLGYALVRWCACNSPSSDSGCPGCRIESRLRACPMCKQEYMEWFTSKCPIYRRLTEEAADQAWLRDLKDPLKVKDQVPSNLPDGTPGPDVMRIWIHRVGAEGEEKDLVHYQDEGVRKEDEIQVKAPTELQHQKLAAMARDIRQSMNDLDDDTCDQGFAILDTPEIGQAKLALNVQTNAAIQSAGAAGRGKAKAKPKPKAGKSKLPGVVASTVRRDTVKPYTAVMAAIPAALSKAEEMLKEAEGAYDTLENAVLQDAAVRTVQHRRACLKQLDDRSYVRPTEASSGKLHKLLCEDKFFAEQGWSPEHVQTVGQIDYTRGVLLDLQCTAEAVEVLGATHKESLHVLQTVGNALTTECRQWKSNLAARELEEKAKAKEENEPAGEGAATEALDGVDGVNRAKRRRKARGATGDMTDDDPAILVAAANAVYDKSFELEIFNDLNLFLDHVRRTAGMASPGINEEEVKNFNKKIVKDMNSFASDFEAAQSANAQQTQAKKPLPERQVRMMVGPADTLGLDGLMMHEVDESRCTTLQFLNRGEVAKKPRFAEIGHDDNAKAKSQLRISGLAIVGAKLHSTYAGFLPVRLGSIYYHASGDKLLAAIDIQEAIDWYRSTKKSSATSSADAGLPKAYRALALAGQEVMTFLANQDFAAQEDECRDGLRSLRMGSLLPGDVVYFPPCCLTVDKALAQHNLGIRATSMFFNATAYRAYQLYRTVYSADMGAEVMSIVLNKLKFNDGVDAGAADGNMKKLADREDKVIPAGFHEDTGVPAGFHEATAAAKKGSADDGDHKLRAKIEAWTKAQTEEHLAFAKNHARFDDFLQHMYDMYFGGEEPDAEEFSFGAEGGDHLEDLISWFQFLAIGSADRGGKPAPALEWVPTNAAEALLAKAADESVQQAMLTQGPGSLGVMSPSVGETAEAANHDQQTIPDKVNSEPPHLTEAAHAASQQMQDLDKEMDPPAAQVTDDAPNPEQVKDTEVTEAPDAASQQMLQPEDKMNPANANLADAANALAVPVQPDDAMTPVTATVADQTANPQSINEAADAVKQQMRHPDDMMDCEEANVAEAAEEATVLMQESEPEAEAEASEAEPAKEKAAPAKSKAKAKAKAKGTAAKDEGDIKSFLKK